MIERFKILRKTLGLSREDFAKRLGLKSRGKIENIELGRTVPDNEFLKLICKEFNVSETWLFHGTGEMFNQESDFDLDKYIRSQDASPLELEMTKAFFSLDKNVRKQILKTFVSVFQNVNINDLD